MHSIKVRILVGAVKDLCLPLWRGGPNTRTSPIILLTLPASKAADMAHLCVPQNQALGVCRGFVPDIQVCGTDGREVLVNATITPDAEEEEEEEGADIFCLPLSLTSHPHFFLSPSFLLPLYPLPLSVSFPPFLSPLLMHSIRVKLLVGAVIFCLWGSAEGLFLTSKYAALTGERI